MVEVPVGGIASDVATLIGPVTGFENECDETRNGRRQSQSNISIMANQLFWINSLSGTSSVIDTRFLAKTFSGSTISLDNTRTNTTFGPGTCHSKTR